MATVNVYKDDEAMVVALESHPCETIKSVAHRVMERLKLARPHPWSQPALHTHDHKAVGWSETVAGRELFHFYWIG